MQVVVKPPGQSPEETDRLWVGLGSTIEVLAPRCTEIWPAG